MFQIDWKKLICHNWLVTRSEIIFFHFAWRVGDGFHEKSQILEKKNHFILLYSIFYYYYCSIKLKMQSEHTGFCPDTSSLVVLFELNFVLNYQTWSMKWPWSWSILDISEKAQSKYFALLTIQMPFCAMENCTKMKQTDIFFKNKWPISEKCCLQI